MRYLSDWVTDMAVGSGYDVDFCGIDIIYRSPLA
jgi:hypothetical protein